MSENMDEYLRNIRQEEQSKNINIIKASGWYPSNLVSPVKVNGRIFYREKMEKEKDEDLEEFINSKNESIKLLKTQNKIIESNPMKLLSSQKDEFSYTHRLVPLYKTHMIYK